MLTGIQMYNELGALVLTLPVFGSSMDSRYIVKNVEGLDPVKAELSTASTASLDGVSLMSSRVGARNIILTIGYNPDNLQGETTAALRRDLYEQFPPKGELRLRFLQDDFETLRIEGVVESHEVVLFSREPEVQISIICPNPYFESLNDVVFRGFNSAGYTPLKVLGTAPTGFVFRSEKLSDGITSVILENRVNSNVEIQGQFLVNDTITVSTIPKNKYARRTRTGSTVSILDGLVSGHLSMALDSRTTSFKFHTNGTAPAGEIAYTLTYTPKFVGI